MSDFAKRLATLTPKQLALLATRLQAKLDAAERARTEPIAVVGMGCRFPGGSNDPDSFWQLLREGRDAVTEVPASRWEAAAYYDPDPETPGKAVTRWGAFIEGVEEFDAPFFGVSPREAAAMDPQQRLLLEVSWEALEEAGQTADRLAGSKTGVFIGIYNSDYGRIHDPLVFCEDLYSSSGNAFSIAANRLSYAFDLQGPSVAVDTACSSSLFAVHLACQSLRTGDSNLALAGGVNIVLSPYGAVHLSRMGMMSATGRCRTFDAGADGFVRSEGCGVIILKRLSDALADGDRIQALIRGSAVNNDGRTNGLTAPNGLSQQAVVRQALANARVQPSQVSYVEAHGTGTPLGDPIEVESLSAVVGQADGEAQRCLLGSVKTNIGHMEAAAGIAAIIKVVLSLEHEQIPPHLHFHKLNPHIDLEGTRLEVATRGGEWPRGEKARYAGVSSFGFGGANAHVILEEGPVDAAPRPSSDAPQGMTYLLPLSARSPEALPALAQRFLDFLQADPEASTDGTTLRDLCYTAGARRSHHQHRLCVAAGSYDQLRRRLTAYLSGDELALGVFTGSRPSGRRPKVAFIFSGQGSQWPGMGRGLFETEPAFRKKLEECASAMLPHLDGWSLLEQFTSEPDEQLLRRIDVVQPLLFAVQVSLAALWRSWGVEPEAVVGHSMGEVAAAHVSGALSLEDASRVICLRARLMRRLSGRGAMAVVELSAEQAEAAISSAGEGGVEVAASNGPRTTVVSGEAEAVRRLVAGWQAGNVYSREVAINVASHSWQVEEIEDELLAALEGVRGARGAVAMYSTLEAREVSGEELTAGYWARNLRERVRFMEAVWELRRRGFGVFVEVSPHPVLTMAVEESVRGGGGNGAGSRGGAPAAVVVGTLRKESVEGESIREAVGRLYAGGVDVGWEAINGGRGRCVKLPRYPWQRQRYWFGSDGPQQSVAAAFLQQSAAVPRDDEQISDWLYELRWRAETGDEDSGEVEPTPGTDVADATVTESGTWLIFADRDGVAEALAARLGATRARTLLVYPGPDFQRLSDSEYRLDPARPEQFQSLMREVMAVEQSRLTLLHMWGLDVRDGDYAGAEELMRGQLHSCGSLLHLAQAMPSVGVGVPVLLWVITRGAQPVGDGRGAREGVEVAQSPLWGLGRTIAGELRRQCGGLIDLDPQGDPVECAEQIVTEVARRARVSGPVGTQTGYRAGLRYVPRMERARAAEAVGAGQQGAVGVSAEATYLITGGMGGLGLKVASSLVSRGAKHLLLTGRREPSEEARKAIEELKQAGAEVSWQLADVGEAEEVRELFAAPGRLGWPELKGVVHAAGVIDDGVLANQSWERFERVMRSKVMGARNLADAAEGLDFFVLFSSASSVVGAPGQANYAAANAYLDGLAQAGRAKGERWLSINWGAWAEVGLVAARAWELNAIGIGSMKPEQALEAMWRVVGLEEAVAQVIIIQVDWEKYARRLPNSPVTMLLKGLISPDMRTDPQQEQLRKLLAGQGRTKLPQEEPRKLLMQLEAAPEHERFDLVVVYLRELTTQVMRVDSPQSLAPDMNFLEMGLDSLTGLEVRNRLEVALGTSLPVQMFWEYPTLNQLAAHLCDHVGKPSAAGDEGAAGNGHHPPESGQQQLSADQAEALSMLLNEIESVD